MVSSGGFFSSNLYSLYNVVQNTQILYPKELIISTLREYFGKDIKYHYVSDEWGFPKVPDHTDLKSNAGMYDDLTTRIYIGQEAKFNVKFYPAVLIKNTKTTYNPISFNQETECLEYEYLLFDDGYGNNTSIKCPTNFVIAGRWDLGFDIEILAEGPQDRSTIVEATCMLFQTIMRDHLIDCGLFVKNVSVGAESFELYQNDNIYKQTVSLDCQGEFRRRIPITNVIDSISICIELGHYMNAIFEPDPNLQINYDLDLTNTVLQRFTI